jgi:septal ring factor EnvC (AmiA/AmiB activator)
VVDEIRSTAERETAEEIAGINAEKARLEKELQEIVSSAKKGEEHIIAKEFVDKQRALEFKIRQTERELRDVQKKRREKIEQLGSMLQNINTSVAPAVILLVAIILSIRRSVLRRRYVSHASDA